MADEILALHATDKDPQSADYTPVPSPFGTLWVRLTDVTDAADELDAAEADTRDGEAFIDTIHLPIA